MNNNNNIRSRSSSLPPLRQTQVRASALPSDSSPIMEQSGEINNEVNNQSQNELVNTRISVLEDLIRNLISSLPIEGTATTSATSSSSTSLPEPAAETVAPTTVAIRVTKEVNKRNYVLTSASVMAIFNTNKITATCKDSFAKISMIRGALSTAGLTSMLDGYRILPITSELNPFGYSEKRKCCGTETDPITGEVKIIEIMLDEDDVFCFNHDKGRLFMAVTEMFSPDLRYLVRSEITNCDGVGMYLKIMDHLNGQRSRDADVARESFNSYKMDEHITFKQERSKFEEVFKTLEYAQKMKIVESDKIQFITTRLINDRRVGLKEVILQSRINNFTYDKTVDLLVQINEEMSDKNQTVKMAGVFTPKTSKKANSMETPIKYCYNFNESGECRFGASCIYSHNKDPNHVTREPREKPSYPDSSSKIPPKHVNKSDRTPNGGEKFKGGYKGKTSKVKFNKIKTSDDNASFKSITINNEGHESEHKSSPTPFESWHIHTEKPTSIPFENTNNFRMNMINVNDSLHNNEESEFSDDQIDPKVPVKRSADFANRSQTIKPIQLLQLQHSCRTRGSPLQDLEAIHNLNLYEQMHFFHATFIRLKYPCNVEYDHPGSQGGLLSIFTGFKWNPRCLRLGDIIEELRNPTGSVMEMIYRMNDTFMGAEVVHTIPIITESTVHAGNFDISQYSNFRTMGSHEGQPGYYKSTMPDLTAYLTVLQNIKRETNEPNLETGNIYLAESTAQLMVWGVVYDFMSFCTNLYGQNYEESETSIANSRLQLIAHIAKYRSEDFCFGQLQHVFLSIARSANGILANAFIPKMINDHNEDSETEDDLNNDNMLNKLNKKDIDEPPVQKRQCKRMSVFSQSK